MGKTIECHSTRLFPKNLGASSYQITGIASRCDWIVLSDKREPRIAVHKNEERTSPRHIFLSLRDPFSALLYFVEIVLPQISGPFILISGSEDVTIPHQTDKRWRAFNAKERRLISHLLDHPFLSFWFAENLQDDSHPKLQPLPLGMVFTESQSHVIAVPRVPPLVARPLRILCAHRVRSGEQWIRRRQVTGLAKSVWSKWCTVLDEEVSEEVFIELVEQHRFVLCVDGGGIDPSPKAWQVILHGAIPIIRETALKTAYEKLPIVEIPDWQEQHITEEKLNNWSASACAEEQQACSQQIRIERLGIDYWWQQIIASISVS